MKPKMTSERGQALILIALAMVGMVAIVGLAIDGSRKFSDQRHAQNAADTAAIAAALAKVDALKAGKGNSPTVCPPPSGPPSAVCTDLLNAGGALAQNNGYTNNLTTSTVEIYSPPISGHYINDADYVQVIITSFINTTFSKVIGITQTQNIVQAVALAKPEFTLAQGAMIISYDPNPSCPSGPGNGGGSVDVSGSSTLNLNGGGFLINSGIACGFSAPNCPVMNITGGAGINSVAVSPLDNVYQKGPPSCLSTPVSENFNQPPIAIPDDVYWPKVPAECGFAPPAPTKLGEIMAGSPPKLTGEWLIYPGYYETFPPSDLVGNKQLIYMKSGVYCIDPGGPTKDWPLSWSPVDFVSLNGSTKPAKNKYHTYNPDGVTLYIRKGGGFAINANNPTFLDASKNPSSDYQGYLIILEGVHTSIQSCAITGGATIDINGMIFAPYCNITVNGGSDSFAEINAQLIGWDLKINGNNTINFNYDPSNQVKIKRKVGLMK